MAEEKKQERRFELRSEKVRSIVGQIPTSLVRYGISVIGLVLCVLVGVAYLLPYKQVYSGGATIYEFPKTTTGVDSTEVRLLLRFENKGLSEIPSSLPIQLQIPNNIIEGQLLSLTAQRDTLERQISVCRFATNDIKSLEPQSVDFKITYSSGNLLQKMLGGMSTGL